MTTCLKSIELRHYRSCNKTGIELHSNLSALIGVNGSGKTNFLNGIMLLKELLRTTRYVHEEDIMLSRCKVKAIFAIGKKLLPFQATITYSTNERNIDEVVSAVQTWNLVNFTGIDKPVSFPLSAYIDFREFALYQKKPKNIPERQWRRIVAARVPRVFSLSGMDDPNTIATFARVLEQVRDFVAGITYYRASEFTDPSRCPTYLEIKYDRGLRKRVGSREDHQQFIHDLYVAYKKTNREYQEFISFIGSEGIGLIDEIEFQEIEVPLSDIEVGIGGRITRKEIKNLLVIPTFLVKGNKLSPNQLSEGTFKTLAIVFYLVTGKSRLLLLEEPEVCIHHGLLRNLLELIRVYAKVKQIVISTHSDFVLDSLDPENVFLVKYDGRKGTSIKRVPNAMSKRDYQALREYLATSGGLGEYWRHGELEQ